MRIIRVVRVFEKLILEVYDLKVVDDKSFCHKIAWKTSSID